MTAGSVVCGDVYISVLRLNPRFKDAKNLKSVFPVFLLEKVARQMFLNLLGSFMTQKEKKETGDAAKNV